ncbi:MAG: hypothetical protein HY556_04895 [Euryarchaeota archaeon]|nr:hypothetical protein [Euryarchaeota archaeon]
MRNDYAFNITVNGNLTTSDVYVNSLGPSRFDQILTPGATAQVSPRIIISNSAPENRVITVFATYSIANATGVRFFSGAAASTTLTVIHPTELVTVVVDSTGRSSAGINIKDAELGTTYSYTLRATETKSWKGVNVTGGSSSNCGGRATGISWKPTIEITRTTVGAGTTQNIGAISVFVPPEIDPKQFRGVLIECTATFDQSARGFSLVSITFDPIIPPRVELEINASETGFLFDKKKTEDLMYETPVEISMTNWGEQDWSGLVSLTNPSDTGVRINGDAGGVTLNANTGPHVVAGRLLIPASHGEGAFNFVPTPATSAGPPLLRATTLSYAVSFAASLQMDDQPSFGELVIGESAVRSIQISESLGYADVPVTVQVAPKFSSTRIAMAAVPTTVTVPAGGSTSVSLNLDTSPGATPGCDFAWEIQMIPGGKQRSGLSAQTTIVHASMKLSNVENIIGQLVELKLPASGEAGSLLERLSSDGCSLSRQDLEAARKLIQAVPTLIDVESRSVVGGTDTLLTAAIEFRAARDFTEGNHSALLEVRNASLTIRARLLDALSKEANATLALGATPDTLDRLSSLGSGAQILGDADLSASIANKTEELDATISRKYSDGLASLSNLFSTPTRTEIGFKLGPRVGLDPNPFHWVTLERLAAETKHDAARSKETFASLGPLAKRVEAGSTEADLSLASARNALVAGAAVDALVGLGLVGLATRTLRSYARDLADVDLGSDVLG